MAHVFIVNKITFKTHLEHMFAGTGAADVPTDFIFDTSIKLNTQDEKRSVGMITDVSRVRKGDKIIFFVTGIARFYGVFEAVSEFFLDPNDNSSYLFEELGKKLTYRILIKPFKVYKYGLSEYDYLDSLEGIQYPDQICWSLIYRKLGGNRGCTMITEQEYDLFIKRIEKENDILSGDSFSFDSENNVIIPYRSQLPYEGRQINIVENLRNNMLNRYENKKAFEHYVQYFSILDIKNNPNSLLLVTESPVVWIGNEVMCSFGEHRIDAFVIQSKDNLVDITLIEMKDEKAYSAITWQIDGYMKWIKDYILPSFLRDNAIVRIHPVVISDGIPNARNSTKEKLKLVETEIIAKDWSIYNKANVTVEKTKIIHFQDLFL